MTGPGDRLVVLLCGPPGAGKTTAAHQSGLTVYDRDDPRWPDERSFRRGIEALVQDPHARAVVIRSGATSSARAKAAARIGATHTFLLTAHPDELAQRIIHRNRADLRPSLASLKPWFDSHDTKDHVRPFPGWDALGPPTHPTGPAQVDWDW